MGGGAGVVVLVASLPVALMDVLYQNVALPGKRRLAGTILGRRPARPRQRTNSAAAAEFPVVQRRSRKKPGCRARRCGRRKKCWLSVLESCILRRMLIAGDEAIAPGMGFSQNVSNQTCSLRPRPLRPRPLRRSAAGRIDEPPAGVRGEPPAPGVSLVQPGACVANRFLRIC